MTKAICVAEFDAPSRTILSHDRQSGRGLNGVTTRSVQNCTLKGPFRSLLPLESTLEGRCERETARIYRLVPIHARPSFEKEQAAISSTTPKAISWRKSTFAEYIEVKVLGSAKSRSKQLVRFTPGASFPLNRHEGPEFIYLLEGVAIQQGQHLSRGWAAVAAMGTTDSDFHSPAGCVFLTVYTDQAGVSSPSARNFEQIAW